MINFKKYLLEMAMKDMNDKKNEVDYKKLKIELIYKSETKDKIKNNIKSIIIKNDISDSDAKIKNNLEKAWIKCSVSDWTPSESKFMIDNVFVPKKGNGPFFYYLLMETIYKIYKDEGWLRCDTYINENSFKIWKKFYELSKKENSTGEIIRKEINKEDNDYIILDYFDQNIINNLIQSVGSKEIFDSIVNSYYRINSTNRLDFMINRKSVNNILNKIINN
jgi:hypothetical protein